jgi:hypothetical protein
VVSLSGVRAGKARLGCLIMLAVLAAALYEGFNAGEVYFRYYRLQDFVNGQAGLADVLTDDVILDRLVGFSDTLGVNLGPRDWHVERSWSPREIHIDAEYRDSIVIELARWRKVFYVDFKPSAKAPL